MICSCTPVRATVIETYPTLLANQNPEFNYVIQLLLNNNNNKKKNHNQFFNFIESLKYKIPSSSFFFKKGSVTSTALTILPFWLASMKLHFIWIFLSWILVIREWWGMFRVHAFHHFHSFQFRSERRSVFFFVRNSHVGVGGGREPVSGEADHV